MLPIESFSPRLLIAEFNILTCIVVFMRSALETSRKGLLACRNLSKALVIRVSIILQIHFSWLTGFLPLSFHNFMQQFSHLHGICMSSLRCFQFGGWRLNEFVHTGCSLYTHIQPIRKLVEFDQWEGTFNTFTFWESGFIN